MPTSFELLTQGKILEAILEVYFSIFPPGTEYIFYAFVMTIGLVMIYVKTKNYGTVGIVGLLLSASVLPFIPPEFHLIPFGFLFLSILIIFFKIFKR